MTTWVAPLRRATCGVANRTWSVAPLALSWMPGVTMSVPAGNCATKYPASFADATTPWQPQAAASLAKRSTCARTDGARPISKRSSSPRLVMTVSAMILRPGNGAAAATAARSTAEPPDACTVTMVAPSFPAACTAPATEFGISCSLRSKKTSLPMATSSRTMLGPSSVRSCRPTLYEVADGPSAWTSASACALLGKSRATMTGDCMSGMAPERRKV
ncbi:hypothetical protein SAMN05216303_104208 [Rhodoferax sp. OV413]|nr:hypothetical protein SAMN05216303_104208 [Rhodoferax sp. OV413]